jgi:hypothetical protein
MPSWFANADITWDCEFLNESRSHAVKVEVIHHWPLPFADGERGPHLPGLSGHEEFRVLLTDDVSLTGRDVAAAGEESAEHASEGGASKIIFIWRPRSEIGARARDADSPIEPKGSRFAPFCKPPAEICDHNSVEVSVFGRSRHSPEGICT